MAPFPDPPFIVSLLIASAIFFFVAAGVMLVLWIAMPFSLFGLKASLKRMAEQQEESNRLLRSLLNLITEQDERQRRTTSSLGAAIHEPKDPKEPLQ